MPGDNWVKWLVCWAVDHTGPKHNPYLRYYLIVVILARRFIPKALISSLARGVNGYKEIEHFQG